MKFDNLEEIIRTRKSIRIYENKPLNANDKEKIKTYIEQVINEDNSFNNKIKIYFLEGKKDTDTEKLGTYGVIKGTNTFLGVTVKNSEYAMETVGYVFEKLVLLLTKMGIGTCWLAGTFNKDNFKNAMNISDDEIFPIVCPIGYPSDKSSLVNKLFRKASNSDNRKPFNELFFSNNFETPLTKDEASKYEFPLEMLRLAPSAANRQPWRVLKKDNNFHFYKEINPKSKYSYDLQKLDVGIGFCHFHLAVQEKELKGKFFIKNPNMETPNNLEYLFSWIAY